MLGIIITRRGSNVEIQRLGPYFSQYVADMMLERVKREAKAFPVKVRLENVKSLNGFYGKFDEDFIERMNRNTTSAQKPHNNSKTTFQHIDSIPSSSDWSEDQIRKFEEQALGAGTNVQAKLEKHSASTQPEEKQGVGERKEQDEPLKEAITETIADTITIENQHVNALFAITGKKDGMVQSFEVQANTPWGAAKHVSDRGYTVIETKRIPKKK